MHKVEINLGIMAYICIECGVKYLSEEQKKRSNIATFHDGECVECKSFKSVTDERLYNWRNKKQ